MNQRKVNIGLKRLLMMKKLCFFVFLSLFLALSASAQELMAVKNKVKDGYNFWLYTPGGEMPEQGKPLVIYLHGKSLCGTDLNKVKRYGTITALEKGREIDAFVIAPQNPGGSWDPDKVMDVVDYVCDNYNVDENMIYVLGMSLGGYGTLDLAAAYPDRIAAAIGMCGGATQRDLTGLADIPLWIIHGTGDSKVPVGKSDNVVNAVKAAQTDGVNRMIYDRIPGMDHSKPARVFYNPVTYEWLFQHRLDTPGRPLNWIIKADEEFFSKCYEGLNWKGTQNKETQQEGLENEALGKAPDQEA